MRNALLLLGVPLSFILLACGSGGSGTGTGASGPGGSDTGSASGGNGGSDGSMTSTSSTGSSSSTGGSGGAPPAPITLCQPGCQTAADCVTPNYVAYDASHYKCDGFCKYLGCKNDAECQQLNPKYVCAGEAIKVCQPGCQTAADCTTPNYAAYDASHYKCTGVCEYLGCKNDAECQQLNPKYVCAGEALKVCQPGCQTAADCTTPNYAAYDASHYECDGVCKYLGCKNDGECQQLNPKFVCE